MSASIPPVTATDRRDHQGRRRATGFLSGGIRRRLLGGRVRGAEALADWPQDAAAGCARRCRREVVVIRVAHEPLEPALLTHVAHVHATSVPLLHGVHIRSQPQSCRMSASDREAMTAR